MQVSSTKCNFCTAKLFQKFFLTKKAFKILENFSTKVVFTDIQLSGINGFEANKLIKTNSKLKYIPIIVLSANATKSEIKKNSRVFDQ